MIERWLLAVIIAAKSLFISSYVIIFHICEVYEKMTINEIIMALVTGLISGIVSSYLVYLFTKKREEKEHIYNFWRRYLFSILEEKEIWIPLEELDRISAVGNKDSEWHACMFEIIQMTRPNEAEDSIYSNEEGQLLDLVMKALKELEKWHKNSK